MPRRKAAEIEILPPEDNQSSKRGRKTLVEAEHTIKYSAPVPVTIEESPDEEPDDVIDDEVEEKPHRKYKNEREELRKKLALNNITPGSHLKLSVDRYLHSEMAEGGNWAETEFLTKYVCTEAHITNEDYLDVVRKWGAGTYRFTLRMNNKILTAWDKRLGVITPTIQNAIPGDPNSPQVIVQGDGQQPVGQVMSMKELMKSQREAFKEQLEMAKLMREAYGLPESAASPAIASDPKIAALQLIAENPDVMEKISSGIAKTVLGSKGGDDSDPWAEVAKEAIKSGQAAEIVASLVREFMAPFKNLWGNNNGQPQMAPQTIQNQAQPVASDQQGQFVSGVQVQSQQISAHPDHGGTVGTVEGNVFQGGNAQMVASPEDQALQLVIDHCARNLPPQIAFNRLMSFADAINDQAPAYSIDGYIVMFASMPADAAIDFVKSQPGGEAVASLSHTKTWTEALQRLIQSQEAEGEE